MNGRLSEMGDQFAPGAAVVENDLNAATAIKHMVKAQNSGLNTCLIS